MTTDHRAALEEAKDLTNSVSDAARNLAACYLELRELAKAVLFSDLLKVTDEQVAALREVLEE